MIVMMMRLKLYRTLMNHLTTQPQPSTWKNATAKSAISNSQSDPNTAEIATDVHVHLTITVHGWVIPFHF